MLTSSPVLGAVLVLTRRASLCSTSILDPGCSGLPVPGVISSSRGASASTDSRARFLAVCVCVAPLPDAAASPPTPLFFASLALSTCADALCLLSLDCCAALQAALVDLSDPLSAFLTIMGVMPCHTSSERGIQGTPLSALEPRRPHSLCNLCWEGRSLPFLVCSQLLLQTHLRSNHLPRSTTELLPRLRPHYLLRCAQHRGGAIVESNIHSLSQS